jgi:NitT/TauT family transport system ATP-binding protein
VISSQPAPPHDQPLAPSTSSGTSGLIEFCGVTHRFTVSGRRGAAATEIHALDNVDLKIPAGEFVAIVGASGCGKTTLLNMVAGLIRPTDGTVTVMDRTPRLPNADIGYMFARDALLPWRRALENVALPLEVRRWNKRERHDRAAEILKMVGLEGRERQYPLQLSQGMRQRVALARTLSADPDLLLMDEPFAALDARTKLTMQAEFLRIWEASGTGGTRKTVLFVTHDLSEAVLLADRVVVMLPHPGRIAEDRVMDLPRPRAESLSDLMFTEQFRRITRELFDRLEGAIR